MIMCLLIPGYVKIEKCCNFSSICPAFVDDVAFVSNQTQMNNIEITPPLSCNNSLIELLALADSRISRSGSTACFDIGGPYSRDKAWEHCYEFFRQNGQELCLPSPSHELLAQAASEVSCYLAFFGMFRGSKLLNTNRDFFIPVIQNCWQQVPESLNPMGTTNPVFVANTRRVLRKSLKEQFSRIGSSTLYVSDILVSKIMLGMFACTPAYDSNVHTRRVLRKSLKEQFSRIGSSTLYVSDILVSKIMLGMFACTPAYDSNVQRGILELAYSELAPTFNANISKWHAFMTTDIVDALFREKRKSYYGCDSDLPLNRIADLFFFQLGFTSNL